MTVEQQDRLVNLIYRCPNQFLFAILKDIGENFDDFINDLYEEIATLRKEKNIAEISIQSVKRVLEQISSVFLISLSIPSFNSIISTSSPILLLVYSWLYIMKLSALKKFIL